MATMPRSLRIPEDLWTRALETARRRGETLTDVAVRAFEQYVDEPDPEQ